MVAPRAREALNDQRETARRALLPLQGGVLAATQQQEAAPRQHFVNTLARHNEAHNYNVQMQIELEHEAFARLSQKTKELLSRFSQEANQALESQRESFARVSKYMIHEPNKVFNALRSEDVTQQQCQEYAGQHRHLTEVIQETQQHREMVEDS